MCQLEELKGKLNTVFLISFLIILMICARCCENTSAVSVSEEADTLDSVSISDVVQIDTSENDFDISDVEDVSESDDTSDAEDVSTVEELSAISEDEMVDFNPDEPFSYCSQPVCRYNSETGMVDFTIHFNSVPKSDDLNIYLYEVPGFEKEEFPNRKENTAVALKNYDVTLSFPYSRNHIFSRFVPVLFYNDEVYPLSLGQYITNPEDLAENTTPYPEITSKKGLLLDPMTLDKKELNDLNVKRVVYNIPLSFIMGETENETRPTIDFEYLGITYHFNGFALDGFDSMFSYLTENDYHITAIILNDFNTSYPAMMHPLSRGKKAMYYAFNTEEEEGVRAMEAAALFLAKRYTSGEYGLIHDWIIANEINHQKYWNYMNTDNVDFYVDSFEQAFRCFYNAIKSNYANARVSFSIDHDWNNNGGQNYRYFNGKDLMNSFNEIAKSRGNYDWGLSIHPYPSPLTNTRFWYGYRDKSEKAQVITPMNMTVLTDFMRQDDFLDTNGNVRHIGVTELGFSSKSGEKTQAAAFAYCYYIIDDNEYIDSFLMNRQTDSYLSLRSGLALGIYNPDYSVKYIGDVFANIDTEKGNDYIPEMLQIIGARSLDEALSWAK